MWKEGKPKKQSEKCEVSRLLHNRWPFHLHQGSDKPGRIDSAIIAKLLAKNVEHIFAGAWMS